MDMHELTGPFERILCDLVTPSAIRAVERGENPASIWVGLQESGFLDALVPENKGGAGLTLAQIFPLVALVGAYAVPVPVGETMIARALLAAEDLAIPDGPIAFATASARGQVVPCALASSHVLFDNGAQVALLPAEACKFRLTGVAASLAAHFDGSGQTPQVLRRPENGLRPLAAVLRAMLIAGAAGRLVELTAVFANERVQFGKPIGRQQALQQNLAVMAEDMVCARLAAQLGAQGGLEPALAQAATAKAVSSAAAVRIANVAHAIHGAIGISEEYDLQLLSRRLHEWRLADGSETYWNNALGAARLSATVPTVDWVRANVFA